MDRRAFISLLSASIVAAPLATEAQQAAKIPRIGYLAGNLATGPSFSEAFRQGLRDLGYVEGRDVLIEFKDAQGKAERLPALAAELVAHKVDIILAPGTQHAMAAKQATATIDLIIVGRRGGSRLGGASRGSHEETPFAYGKCACQV